MKPLLPSMLFVFMMFLLPGFSANSQELRRQQEPPFELFSTPIDNRAVYRHFERTATRMMQTQGPRAVEEFQEQLAMAPSVSQVSVNQLRSLRPDPEDRQQVYQFMVKSTLYIGELYNCGKCDRTHAGFAGGVLISEDGLALTNYHVLESRDAGKTEGLYAMTWDGQCWGIEEVLAASKNDDLALIRLRSNGQRFHAAPLAPQSPGPMDEVRIISHPFGEFFVMTHGEVSRYTLMRKRRDPGARKPGVWMEVTAPFGSGSSGCGVFNNQGEVVGLVSSIRPLFRDPSGREADSGESAGPNSKTPYVEMLIRKCVPLTAIRSSLTVPEKR
jgi:S1-C subfamily serine protease